MAEVPSQYRSPTVTSPNGFSIGEYPLAGKVAFIVGGTTASGPVSPRSSPCRGPTFTVAYFANESASGSGI